MTQFLAALNLSDAWMVEVGSYQGESTEAFAKTGKFICIHAVDPWVDNYDPEEPGDMSNMAEVEAAFDKRVAAYPIIHKIKSTSAGASHLFLPQSLGLVYVDGRHQYHDVKEDIALWMPKICRGGYMSGHDYGTWPGVKQAVDEVFDYPDAIFPDNSWMVRV
jgi:hypothetical protein